MSYALPYGAMAYLINAGPGNIQRQNEKLLQKNLESAGDVQALVQGPNGVIANLPSPEPWMDLQRQVNANHMPETGAVFARDIQANNQNANRIAQGTGMLARSIAGVGESIGNRQAEERAFDRQKQLMELRRQYTKGDVSAKEASELAKKQALARHYNNILANPKGKSRVVLEHARDWMLQNNPSAFGPGPYQDPQFLSGGGGVYNPSAQPEINTGPELEAEFSAADAQEAAEMQAQKVGYDMSWDKPPPKNFIEKYLKDGPQGAGTYTFGVDEYGNEIGNFGLKKPDTESATELKYRKKEENKNRARKSFGAVVETMAGLLRDLDASGAMVDPNNPNYQNAIARARNTAGWRLVEEFAGTQTAQDKGVFDALRTTVLHTIRTSNELGVRGMDTKAEAEMYLQQTGNLNLSIEANMALLDKLWMQYGPDDTGFLEKVFKDADGNVDYEAVQRVRNVGKRELYENIPLMKIHDEYYADEGEKVNKYWDGKLPEPKIGGDLPSQPTGWQAVPGHKARIRVKPKGN